MAGAPLWSQALAVAGGAAAGALVRWGAGAALNPRWAGFPLGTLAVNLVGGLLVGIALAWFQSRPDEWLRLLVVTGFLGGLTTFSAFSVESLLLLQRGHWALALGHTAAHVAGALLFAVIGHRVATALLAP
ncbi:MAG: fluoride efflux transporter CrcB [Ideonella sp.]|jgi:CrcB protein|nr:fluoride efflux transporter CrcB [Ideonella sp.]